MRSPLKRSPLKIGSLSARHLLLPVALAALVGTGIAFAPRGLLESTGILTAQPTPTPIAVAFSSMANVPAPTGLTQENALGEYLPSGGWTFGGATISFRAESDSIGSLEPEAEIVRLDGGSEPVRVSASAFDVRVADGLIEAEATLRALDPGEYVWRARFIQRATGRTSEWTAFGEADRSFGIVGAIPTIEKARLDGGVARPDKPPLVGVSDQAPFRWEVQTDVPASLDHFVYVFDREETAATKPPENAARLAADARALPVGERDDGWWYLHLWPIDRLGRSGSPATGSVSVLRTPPEIHSLVYRTLPATPPYQTLPIRFALSQSAKVTVSILPKGANNVLRTYDLGRNEVDRQVSLSWDGRDANDKIVPVGSYSFRVHAVDDAGNLSDTRVDGLIISNKAIRVSLAGQSMAAWEGDNVALSTLVTTGGQELPTPAGNFEILSRSAPFTFRSPWPAGSPYWYPNATVRMAMLFSEMDQTFIHDNGGRSVFGPGTNGPGAPGSAYGGSHGCINVPTGAMYQLFAWSEIGTPVIVQ